MERSFDWQCRSRAEVPPEASLCPAMSARDWRRNHEISARALTRQGLLLVNIVGRPEPALSKINHLSLSPPIRNGLDKALVHE
jgi:hypothetical protein